MLDSSHLLLIEEEHKDMLSLAGSFKDKGIVEELPLSELFLQHFLEDALSRLVPHLEDMGSLVVATELLIKDLNLEDWVIHSAHSSEVIVAMVLDSVLAKI